MLYKQVLAMTESAINFNTYCREKFTLNYKSKHSGYNAVTVTTT